MLTKKHQLPHAQGSKLLRADGQKERAGVEDGFELATDLGWVPAPPPIDIMGFWLCGTSLSLAFNWT